jgi:Zn-finger nucleic acid-binding protein
MARRCARCRGIWLDPASFRRLCEEEARPPDDETAIVRSPGANPAGRAASRGDRVRYRACPECAEVMNRSNFGRTSGVVIDVCRPHGAWFDRGELAAIRGFLRSGGLHRYARSRRMERERSSATAPRPIPREASLDDIYDVLAGGDPGWDVPGRVPRLLLVAFFAACAVFLLWHAFGSGGLYQGDFGAGAVVLAVAALYCAWRAFEQWSARR